MSSPLRPLRSPPAAVLLTLLLTLSTLAPGQAAPGQVAPVPARSVPLLLPGAIAYDALGNLYIAEVRAHTVRKVDLLGNLSTIAGSAVQGFSGDAGPATDAQLNSPQGLAINSAGDIFLADSGNNRVRRVEAATGIISTIAGDGRPAFAGDGGPARSASINLPRAICLDHTGANLYIADTRNHRIRRVDLASATITTVAGDGTQGLSGDGGPASSASLDSPESIALDGGGNLYIADTHNGRIREVAAATGRITTISGPALLDLPRGLASDAQGNIYLAETRRNRLLHIDQATGALSLTAGGASQGFAGDGGAPVSAALDSPRAIALSPAGLVSISDSSNGRVRQIVTLPGAASTSIQTIAGLGVAVPGTLALSVPSVVAYGSGMVTASLLSGDPASGEVAFFDVTDGNQSLPLGLGVLSGSQATLSLATVPAGQHLFMATYAGDANHAPAQTAISAVTVSPLPVSAAPNPATITFGSPTPALSGSISGLLPQDSARVTAAFNVAANSQSPAGIYPITVTLAGDGASNYTLQPQPANLTITQANSSTDLQNDSADGSFSGALKAQVRSLTSGSPSGVVTLLANGAALQRSPVGASGLATFSQLALSPGTQVLTATYSGDTNFLPSSSPGVTELITTAPTGDFTIATSDPNGQLLNPGASLQYRLSVQMTGGGLSSPVILSVSGLPPFTSSSFAPALVPPSAGALTPVVLTIASTSARQTPGPGPTPALPLLAALSPLIALPLSRRRLASLPAPSLFTILCVILCALGATGCGDRINNGSKSAAPPALYTVTITGTGTGTNGSVIKHTVALTLQMKSAQ